jgi:hypothetical protein
MSLLVDPAAKGPPWSVRATKLREMVSAQLDVVVAVAKGDDQGEVLAQMAGDEEVLADQLPRAIRWRSESR